MKNNNMLLMSDYYKQSHAMMYPEGTNYLATFLTPRMSRMHHYEDFLICFGIQGFCQDYLIERFNESFFNRDKKEVIDDARYFLKETLSKNYDFVAKMEDLWDLGYLPLRVSALPEGTKCPIEDGTIYAEDGYTRKTLPSGSLLRPIFEDGKMLVKEDINTIRYRLHNGKF